MQTEARFIRISLLIAMMLTFVAVMGTQSRTAFGALAIGLLPLWWRSRHRFALLLVLAPFAVAGLAAMPESWYERMESISDYEQDASFMGRVDAWVIATKVALANPLTGGGFRVPYLQEIADRYLSEFRFARATHSIYFEILGAMGFAGLGLFLAIFVLAFWNAVWIQRWAKAKPEYTWARDLASMAQASLIIYCVAGLTLSIEFWEGPWLLIVILARVRWQLSAQKINERRGASTFRKRGQVVPGQLEGREPGPTTR